MKRRDFLNISIPATGAAMIAPGFINKKLFNEINQQFLGESDFDRYDLIVNGAGLSGYFAALKAANKGKKVLIVDKRTSPGFDFYAKKKLWLQNNGIDRFSSDLKQLFFPEGETKEILHSNGKGLNGSQFGDELALFAGSVRKSMLRNLLLNKVHVLLMTDVCGILSDKKEVRGALLAGKHGLHTVYCKNFIDASDNALFSRTLSGDPYKINKAGFVLELLNVTNPEHKIISVPNSLGLIDNRVIMHPGKRLDHQAFLEFEYEAQSQDMNELEHRSRFIASEIGKDLKKLDESLAKAEIHQFAMENSIFIEKDSRPHVDLSGYHVLSSISDELSCDGVLNVESASGSMINQLNFEKRNKNSAPEILKIAGTEIPYGELNLEKMDEPGLAVPLQKCTFDFGRLIPNESNCQVLVAGGGTAGAMAGLGSAEKGANTIVVDYFNDLGGSKTMGSVMGYYHGVKDNQFFKKHVDEAEGLAAEKNMSNRMGRVFYHLKTLNDLNARIIGSSIICGAITTDSLVEGIVTCRNGRLEIIRADRTIDSTGDGDVAAFAGANYSFGDSRFGQTQNYSQWDIKGMKGSPSNPGRDYDIIDNTRISELQRAFFLSHYEAHFYDFNPMLTVRESRRIEGLYELNLIDAVEKTHFEDMISEASSDYDPHNVGVTPYTRCGFLLPHSNVVKVEIPYRCIVPKDLDGLLISGRGFSQTHNSLQFTRMTADLIVLGYLTGQIAADQVWNNTSTHDYDISEMQNEWADLGYLPPDYASRTNGNLNRDPQEIQKRISHLASGKPEYLYECVRLPKDKALPLLVDTFKSESNPEGKLLLAKAMAWFGEKDGNDLIDKELQELFAQEQSEGYPGGYVDEYDSIRGREKNMLEGLFWRINQNIALLGMAGNLSARNTINHILENTSSGGKMVERKNDYYNGRIDLKIIPFHNRIFNLCFYIDRVPDPVFSSGLKELLTDENIGGYKTESYEFVRWRVFGGSLELAIAAASARCGSKEGYELLVKYLDDIHYIFKKFASSELQYLTDKNYEYDSNTWNNYVAKLSFPQSTNKLQMLEIEV